MRIGYKFTSRTLSLYFLIGIGLIGIVTYIYSNFFIQRIKKEVETTSRIFARYALSPTMDEAALLEILFQEVIQKIDFPVVLTDDSGKPYTSRNVKSKNLEEIVKQFDRHQKPLPITVRQGEETKIVGYVHYGLSPFTRVLRILPFIETAFLIAFLFVGFWGYIIYRKSEEENIWNSLAKETAHQLATPLSSLSGWLVALKGTLAPEVYQGIAEDAERMKEVLEKFSRIGLPPRLTEKTPEMEIKKSVAYIRRRAHARVTFAEEYGVLPMIRFDDILLGWAVENILKNGLDAIGAKDGKITIRTYDAGGAMIEITDTGGGIKKEKDIFKPGYTTKKYGWGLGLVLTKRIVEDYHGGRLTIKRTGPEGTTFQIFIPRSVS
jgi:signal transduction histidine kinase